MGELTPARDISLFQLESQLRELMEFRDTEELTPEERAVVEQQIQEYVVRELAKVDNIRSYMRHCSIMAEAAAEEVKLQSARAHSWKQRLDYLKGCCLDAMNVMGKKKLEGRTGYIQAKGNGGVQSLTVYDDRLLPSNCRVAVIRVNLAEWESFAEECNTMSKSMQVALSRLMTSAGWQSHIEADQKPIRVAMEKPCEACAGVGDVTGPYIVEGVEILATGKCGVCGGTGKQSVPGARLDPRGSHIEVK